MTTRSTIKSRPINSLFLSSRDSKVLTSLLLLLGCLLSTFNHSFCYSFDDYESDLKSLLEPSSRDISLWIDENQIKEFTDASMQIFIIKEGKVLPYLLDPNFQSYLPIITPEVISVNFTWKSGDYRRYQYSFDELTSYNRSVLFDPVISINREGDVPRQSSVFHIKIVCSGNQPGIAAFAVRLTIREARSGVYLHGTPIRLRLKKQCRGKRLNDVQCDAKCRNGGWCNQSGKCDCRRGYLGQFCETALCYPACMNDGVCVSPGVCRCPQGYIGPHCEGGMCREKCLNGGKCERKDSCACRRGYYGRRCEYSKCLKPCQNGARCIGVNKCRCRKGFTGQQCEISSGRNHRRHKKGGKKKFV